MKRSRLSSMLRAVLPWIGIGALLFAPACGNQLAGEEQPQEAAAKSAAADEQALPLKGKLKLPAAPKKAAFGQIYIHTADNREWIYDGVQWVPHDNTVEDFYAELDREKTARSLAKMPQSEVYSTGSASVVPSGAHGKHWPDDFTYCKTCHVRGGVLSFDPNGRAVAPNKPLPSIDANDTSSAYMTCSNISCHGMYAGTFSYYFPGGDGEPELKTVEYSGSGGTTPSWYSPPGTSGCTACHGNPPRNGAWHSGYHAGGPTSASNQCQFCHPDATGSNGLGTAITNPSLHGNGTVNVQARFTASCFGCH